MFCTKLEQACEQLGQVRGDDGLVMPEFAIQGSALTMLAHCQDAIIHSLSPPTDACHAACMLLMVQDSRSFLATLHSQLFAVLCPISGTDRSP